MNCPKRVHGLPVAVLALVASVSASAHPVAATFIVDPAESSLTVEASSTVFSDTDVKPLSGTVDVIFDFGQSSDFPTAAEVTVTGASITPNGTFNLQLGFPQIGLGADITASNLRATVTTPEPPANLMKTAATGNVYEFDAAEFVLTVDQGEIVVTGATNETMDLSAEPVSGVSPTGTLGTVAFTTAGTSGYYTLVNAMLNFPYQITEIAESDEGGLSVELQLDAAIRGTSSFYVALAGVPGDFDQDDDVDAADLPIFDANFGTATGATPSTGDADGDGDSDGDDFLIWQRNVGTAPPPLPATTAVPEPAGALLALAAALGVARWRQYSTRV